MINITLKKSYEDKYKIAQSYFRVILGVLGEDFSPKELELLSFIAVRGNILTTTSRKDFIDMYKTTQATINNTLGRLKKRGFVLKENGRTFVNPKIFSGLNKEISINITLYDREGHKS